MTAGLIIILIAVLIVLAGVGLVINNLIRLKRELDKPVPQNCNQTEDTTE